MLHPTPPEYARAGAGGERECEVSERRESDSNLGRLVLESVAHSDSKPSPVSSQLGFLQQDNVGIPVCPDRMAPITSMTDHDDVATSATAD
jgi:hypothetical protein